MNLSLRWERSWTRSALKARVRPKNFLFFFFFRKKKIEREARDAIVAKYANKADQLERSILAEERQKVPFLVPFF